jgi:hypothetical protein
MIMRCEEYNSPFEPKRYWQKFCSPVCRTKQSIRTQKEYVTLGRKVKEQMNETRAPLSDLFAA